MTNPNDPQDQAVEAFRSIRNQSEGFRKVLKDAKDFRDVPQAAEVLGTLRHSSERKESHTLTVREVTRMFEAGGVARTERSIANWCQVNPQGVARLDAYFDPNERKYFITPQSVELAIAEEKAKAARNTPMAPAGTVQQDTEGGAGDPAANSKAGSERAKNLEKEVMDLKILNSGKDFVIQQLRQERDGFFQQLLESSRKVGELETRLLQLSAPDRTSV